MSLRLDRLVAWSLLVCLTLALGLPAHAAVPNVTLSQGGQAALPIVAGPGRSLEAIAHYQQADLNAIDPTTADPATRVERAIGALAQYLGRMGKTTFAVRHGDSSQAIVVGLATDFPALNLTGLFDPADALRQEEYLIRSQDGGLLVIAATELALEHAVWDLLHRLGYRLYLPGDRWEHVPVQDTLAIAADSFEKPDFHSRLIWYGGGTQDHNRTQYHVWCQRNRLTAGLRVNTSHEYWRIVSRNKEAFAAHPEYYAMVKGERKATSHAKFNVANEDLRKLVVQDGIRWFEANPHELSKSMDPNDFGGWDEAPEAKAIGTPTDQALTLANLVAQSATDHFKADRFVGMYAYYQHQTAPTKVKPHPNVIISFATRFLFSGNSVAQLIADWRQTGVRLVGIREYYGCHYFDRGMPLRSIQGASIDYVRFSIPQFHQQQAKFFTAESSDELGMLGVPHYLASRLLWSADDAAQVDAMVEEYLQQMFGGAAKPMRAFYDILNGQDRAVQTDANGIGAMYAHLAEARQLAQGESPAVRQRIDDLILYLRHVDLYSTYLQAESDPQQAQSYYEQATRHAYRMRDTLLVSINGYIRNTYRRAVPAVTIPANARWNIPEGKNPWKDSTPFGQDEIQAILTDAAKRFAPLNLAADTPAHLASRKPDAPVTNALAVRHLAGDFQVDADAGERIALTWRTNIMSSDFGPTYMVISPSGKIIGRGRVDISKPYEMAWQAQEAGTYRVLTEAHPNAMRLVSSSRVRFLARNVREVAGEVNFVKPRGTVYFRVPAGDQPMQVRVAGQGDGERVRAWLIAPDGQTVEQRDNISGNEPHTFEIPPAHRQQGGVWGLRLAAPSKGHYEDVFVTLPAGVAPWMSFHPGALAGL